MDQAPDIVGVSRVGPNSWRARVDTSIGLVVWAGSYSTADEASLAYNVAARALAAAGVVPEPIVTNPVGAMTASTRAAVVMRVMQLLSRGTWAVGGGVSDAMTGGNPSDHDGAGSGVNGVDDGCGVNGVVCGSSGDGCSISDANGDGCGANGAS